MAAKPESDTTAAVVELAIWLAFWWLFALGGLGWLWRYMTEEKQ